MRPESIALVTAAASASRLVQVLSEELNSLAATDVDGDGVKHMRAVASATAALSELATELTELLNAVAAVESVEQERTVTAAPQNPAATAHQGSSSVEGQEKACTAEVRDMGLVLVRLLTPFFLCFLFLVVVLCGMVWHAEHAAAVEFTMPRPPLLLPAPPAPPARSSLGEWMAWLIWLSVGTARCERLLGHTCYQPPP